MSPAVNAAVGPVARRQIRLESLGPCHLHHWSHRALRELRGGPGGAAAGGVARETPKDTGKGRGLAGGGCGAGSTRWGQLQRKRSSRRGRRSWHRPALGTEHRRGELRLPPGRQGDRVPRGSRGDRSSQGTRTWTQPHLCRSDPGGQGCIHSSAADGLAALIAPLLLSTIFCRSTPYTSIHSPNA